MTPDTPPTTQDIAKQPERAAERAAERCERCLGRGCLFRYPAGGGIRPYDCPNCGGLGQVYSAQPTTDLLAADRR